MQGEMQGRMGGDSDSDDARQVVKLSAILEIVPRGLNNRESDGQASSKKKKTNVCSGRSPWAYLPDDLLLMIISYLTMADFLILGKVCQNWRKFFHATKQEYMDSQPPLVLCIPPGERECCYLCDVFTSIRYEIKLPYLVNNVCRGIANGYLITQDVDNNILLINPITRNLIKFPPMPHPNSKMHVHDHAIVASIESRPGHVLLVVLSRTYADLYFCTSIDNRWRLAYVSSQPFPIRDIVVYKGRVYFMSREFQLGVLSLRTGYLKRLQLYCTPGLSNNAAFVASNDQMLIVDFNPFQGFNVYKMDIPRKELVELEDLGDNSVAYGYKMGSKLCKPGKWGGSSNCLYHIPFFAKVCCVYPMRGGPTAGLRISEGNVFPNGNYWYFPNQSYSLEVVKDE